MLFIFTLASPTLHYSLYSICTLFDFLWSLMDRQAFLKMENKEVHHFVCFFFHKLYNGVKQIISS